MRNRQEWFNEKMAAVSEVQLSADIIARLDAILNNLTLKSIAEISTALGEPLIKVTG